MRFYLPCCFSSLLLLGIFIQPAAAKADPPTYSEPDGMARTCYAVHERTKELVAVVGIKDDAYGFYGYSMYNDAGWPVIILDAKRLAKQPQIISRFTYYHECAHLATPMSDEVMANCIALKKMRANGDLTPDEEQLVANFVISFDKLKGEYLGSGKKFWDATLKCADANVTEVGETKAE